MPDASLSDFATVNDAVAATTKKLQKRQILGEYFRALSNDDLPIAVRFAGGKAFPATDDRALGASGAIVSDAVLRLIHIDAKQFYTLAVEHGEMGEALSTIWQARGSATALPLKQIAHAFDDLASIGNIARKKEIVHDLFAQCATGREAAYLAKIIFSDLRTGVREGVLHDAIAFAFNCPREAVARAQLLTGDLGEVALLAKRDQLRTAHFRLFHPIQFMLATPKETSHDAVETMVGKTYFAEDKLDGIRAQIHKSRDRIAIYTRTMDRIDESFPEIVDAVRKIDGEFLLDGEIVPYRDGKVLPFAHIQKRLGRKVLSAKILRENPAVFIAFDILYRDGELLMDKPLRERRSHFPETLSTQVFEVLTAEQIDKAFSAARDSGNEGLVLKDPDSPYSPGRRGQAWLKIKTHLPTLDCVVTAAEYGHGKRKNSLSDYTFAVWNNDRLVNIGKAYSGATDDEIGELTKIFMELALEQRFGRAFIVQPKIVLEIAFDQIQISDRHESGYALRFPRIKRIRWDKRPQDADRIERVKELYQHSSNTARREIVKKTPEPTLFDHL